MLLASGLHGVGREQGQVRNVRGGGYRAMSVPDYRLPVTGYSGPIGSFFMWFT